MILRDVHRELLNRRRYDPKTGGYKFIPPFTSTERNQMITALINARSRLYRKTNQLGCPPATYRKIKDIDDLLMGHKHLSPLSDFDWDEWRDELREVARMQIAFKPFASTGEEDKPKKNPKENA